MKNRPKFNNKVFQVWQQLGIEMDPVQVSKFRYRKAAEKWIARQETPAQYRIEEVRVVVL